MNRTEALDLLRGQLTTQNLFKHSLAVEAIMGALARRFGEDEDLWRLAGLLHDIDYEYTKDEPTEHSLRGSEMLSEAGLDPRIVYAVKVHNDIHGDPRLSLMDKALFCTDPVTGLITAAALIRPEKKLDAVTAASILKRFGEKSFARGANRETIRACSEIGMSLDDFVAVGLAAMQGISDDLGL
jgi:hypothetical protein